MFIFHLLLLYVIVNILYGLIYIENRRIYHSIPMATVLSEWDIGCSLALETERVSWVRAVSWEQGDPNTPPHCLHGHEGCRLETGSGHSGRDHRFYSSCCVGRHRRPGGKGMMNSLKVRLCFFFP